MKSVRNHNSTRRFNRRPMAVSSQAIGSASPKASTRGKACPSARSGSSARRHIDTFRLAVPDRVPTLADVVELVPADSHVHRARYRHDACLIPRHIGNEGLALLQMQDVEIAQRHQRVVNTHNGLVLIVMGRNVHDVPS